MLSDQRSPYVGRFARGWHRLPGRFPGQPQTRTCARPRIGTTAANPQRGHRVVERARRGDEMDPAGPSGGQRLGARRGRRPGGEDVIDEHDALRRRTGRFEAPSHGRAALGATAPSLRARGTCPSKQSGDGQAGPVPKAHGQRARLVVTSLGQPPTRQRDPRDDVDGRDLVARDDRVREGGRDVAPSGELQPVHGPSRRTVEEERRTSGGHRVRRTVTTGRHRDAGRPSAPIAPGTPQRDERSATAGAERPRPVPASRAPAWENDIERPRQHAPTVPGATDMARAGRPGPAPIPAPRS